MGGTNLYAWGKAGAGTSLGAAAGATPSNAALAAFSPGSTVSVSTASHPLTPGSPFGIAFWVGVGSIALLCIIRPSLPR